MIYRITYKAWGEDLYAVEYATAKEADWHRADIAGYTGITECKITPLDVKRPPTPGPFRPGHEGDPDLQIRLTVWERLG